MTLESTLCVERFVGNGTTKSFSFTFRVWETDQIAVYRKTDDHREADCTGEFTVELNDGGVSGGVVTFLTAPSSGQVIAVCRSMPFIQEDVYLNGSRFDASEVEDRFDQDCAERQQLKFGVSRAVKVPWTDDRTVEEYTQDFWDAVDYAEDCMERSCACADRACDEADRAASEADRSRDEADRSAAQVDRAAEEADRAASEADRAGQLAVLGSNAENLEATWELEADVSAGSTIELPIPYYPQRSVLRVSYDGVEMYLGPQFEEIGDDKDTPSYSIRTLIDLKKGMQFHVWTVMSNVAKYAEDVIARLEAAVSEVEKTASDSEAAIEETKDSCVDEMKDALAGYLEEAEACRDEACACATEAGKSRDQSANSAAEAGESADRADDAAVDAAAAAETAKKAAVCAYKYRHGRRLGAVSDEENLSKVPNGFWVVNPDMLVPATIQHQLTPVPTFDSIPDWCDGFFIIGPAFDDPTPCPEGPYGGTGGTGGTGTPTARNATMQPCGKRSRYSTVA